MKDCASMVWLAHVVARSLTLSPCKYTECTEHVCALFNYVLMPASMRNTQSTCALINNVLMPASTRNTQSTCALFDNV